MIGQTVTITTSPTLIVDGTTQSSVNYPLSALIKNPTGGAIVYLGGPTVDNTGYQLAAGDIFSLDIVGEKLYGVVAAATQAVYVLRRGS